MRGNPLARLDGKTATCTDGLPGEHPRLPKHTRGYPGIPGGSPGMPVHTRAYLETPRHTLAYPGMPGIPGYTERQPATPSDTDTRRYPGTRAYPGLHRHTLAYPGSNPAKPLGCPGIPGDTRGTMVIVEVYPAARAIRIPGHPCIKVTKLTTVAHTREGVDRNFS